MENTTEANGKGTSIPNITNDTMNAISNPWTPGIQIGFTSAYALIFAAAVIGNSLGLFVVWRSSSASVTNLFIANMAVADLLLSLTVMPYSVAYLYSESIWFGGILGKVTCKALFYTIPVSIAASVLTMLVISIDRFYAIFYPLREKLLRRPKVLSSIIWMLSLILMIPNIFLYQVEFIPQDGVYHCSQNWPWGNGNDLQETYRVLTIFHVCLFVILYAVPLSLTALIYFLIARKLWLRKIPGNVTDSNRAAAEKSRRKVVRLLVVIVIVFAVCWLPTYINHYFVYLNPKYWPKIPLAVKLGFYWVSHANSAINPCLYILLNASFRKELVVVLACCPGLNRFRHNSKVGRFLSTKSDENQTESMNTSMWKLMSFGRTAAYTIPRSSSDREVDNGVSNLSLTKLSRKEELAQPSCL